MYKRLFSHSATLAAFLVLALSVAPAADAERKTKTYQWIDKEGVDNWADKNPLTDPSRQPKRDVKLVGKRAMPVLDVEAVVQHLHDTANELVPKLCQERNADNPAQRSICEQFQHRAMNKVSDYIKDPANAHSSFIYERCRKKFISSKRTDFVSLAQCMKVEV